jgi:hypothetical protein
VDKELQAEVRQKNFVCEFYDKTKTVPFKDFIQAIMDEFRIKEKRAKDYIHEWKEKGWLETTSEGYRILLKPG